MSAQSPRQSVSRSRHRWNSLFQYGCSHVRSRPLPWTYLLQRVGSMHHTQPSKICRLCTDQAGRECVCVRVCWGGRSTRAYTQIRKRTEGKKWGRGIKTQPCTMNIKVYRICARGCILTLTLLSPKHSRDRSKTRCCNRYRMQDWALLVSTTRLEW